MSKKREHICVSSATSFIRGGERVGEREKGKALQHVSIGLEDSEKGKRGGLLRRGGASPPVHLSPKNAGGGGAKAGVKGFCV